MIRLKPPCWLCAGAGALLGASPADADHLRQFGTDIGYSATTY
jgi:hypothetical protein